MAELLLTKDATVAAAVNKALELARLQGSDFWQGGRAPLPFPHSEPTARQLPSILALQHGHSEYNDGMSDAGYAAEKKSVLRDIGDALIGRAPPGRAIGRPGNLGMTRIMMCWYSRTQNATVVKKPANPRELTNKKQKKQHENTAPGTIHVAFSQPHRDQSRRIPCITSKYF